ncbi:hypothetical protein Taro_045286 [Colocasia esculenta]|uniref:Transmembrane protein n=1 Tax=Colocasia esculenta TaxID=4460 RepID=A0A843WQV3_COLES|nr:hypothetical protein [Colocasia esculenta]
MCGGPRDVASRQSAFQLILQPPSVSRHQRRHRPRRMRPYRGAGGRRNKGRVATQLPVATSCCRDAQPCRDKLVAAYCLVVTTWLSRRVSLARPACCGCPSRRDGTAMGEEGVTKPGMPQNSAGFCSVWCIPVSRAVPCVPTLAEGPFWGFPEGVPCVPMPARLVSVTSQLCCFYWWLPRQFSFARCSALEGLSVRQVVTITWDPQPCTSVSEGVAPSGRRAQVTYLEQKGKMLVWVSEVVEVLFRCGPVSRSHCLALRWLRSRIGRSQQLVSWRSGLCALLLAAYGGGLDALIVMVFHAVSEIGFLVALVYTVASIPTRSECELQESVAAVAGYACFERGCWFAHATFGFVVGLCIRVGVSQRLREPMCGVALTGAELWSAELVEGVLASLVVPFLLGCVLVGCPLVIGGVLVGCPLLVGLLGCVLCLALCACALLGTVLCSVGIFARANQMFVCRVSPLVECCDTYLWLLPALCWLVVNSGEVFPEFFSTGSGGSEVSPELCCARFWLLRHCPLVEVRYQDYSRLVLPVVVLPQGRVFLAVLVGLRVTPRSGGCFVSRALRALPDGGLVSAMGVWLVVLLWKCQSRLVVFPCVWKRLVVRVSFPCFSLVARGGGAHRAAGAVSRTVVTFAVKVPPLVLS